MVEFTGERVIPGQVEADLWNEHLARYAFAARMAAGKRVLDAGCGAGYGTAKLAAVARWAVGLDISADAVSSARAHYAAPNLLYLRASCAALPFASGSTDLLVSFEVIEHIKQWRQFLDETRRVLAPGGRLVVSTPNKAYYADSRREAGPNPFHEHEFELEEFRAELAARFPCVFLYAENHVESIGFAPLEDAASTWETAAEREHPRTDDEPHFFLAVCSDSPAEPPGAFLFLPDAGNILRTRELHIERLEGFLRRLQAEKEHLVLLLDAAEKTVIERTEWAQRLIFQSRWLRLGRWIGLGPKIGG